MSASLWAAGTAIDAGGTVDYEYFTASEGQTEFLLTKFQYVTGTNALAVYVSGLAQRQLLDYAETSNASITLSAPVPAGTIVYIRAIVGITATYVGGTAGNTIQHSVPVDAGTITITPAAEAGIGNTWLILTPAAALATLTVVFPSSSLRFNGQWVSITTTEILRSVAFDGNGAAIQGTVSVFAADATHQFRYSSATNTWYRCD